MRHAIFPSPAGLLLIRAEHGALKRIDFITPGTPLPRLSPDDPLLERTLLCLHSYFRREPVSFADLPMDPEGTPFQKTVYGILREIPYGELRTYREIAEETARRLHKSRMSAQAVGQAVRSNPLPVVIPCHRVIGSDGSLTGYRYGLEKKLYLLSLEGHDPDQFL